MGSGVLRVDKGLKQISLPRAPKTHFPEKPKKLTKSSARIGYVSLVQNCIKHASEVSEENSCKIFSFKVFNKPPLAHVPFRGFFGLLAKVHTMIISPKKFGLMAKVHTMIISPKIRN